MSFREISLNELPDYLALVQRHFPFAQVSMRMLREGLLGGSLRVFVWAEAKQPVAFSEVAFASDVSARINTLLVKEGFRGKGAGRKCLERVLAFLRGKGFQFASILVEQGNRPAKRLYHSFGFRFMSLYQARGTGPMVEELLLEFSEERPRYVS